MKSLWGLEQFNDTGRNIDMVVHDTCRERLGLMVQHEGRD